MTPDGFGIASSTTESGKTYCRSSSWVDESGQQRGCRDRYYFTGAMSKGDAEYFALGRADGRAGMYISKAVDGAAGRIGVVVAKLQFDKLEESWARAGVPTFVTDSNGVVLISSVKDWRFHTLRPLNPEMLKAIKESGQFGASPLNPMPITQSQAAGGLWSARIAGGPNRKYVLVDLPMPNSDWTLHVLQPAGAEVASAKVSTAFVILISGLLALTIVGIFVRRRARRKVEVEREAAARIELETRVASRTAELTVANDRLRTEMDERRRIARNLNRLQEELVQANKLATLGQITAGVAHELNQPVAAIRAYAANALVLLDRDQETVARKNLGLIGDMTDRISVITGELRAFSRRSTGQTAPVEVSTAIEGALLLTSHRIAVEGVEVLRSGEAPGIVVNADRARLEQVLVNLIQNALDALAGSQGRVLRIEVATRRDRVLIHVADNGAGMTARTFKTLFMPFQTTKANGLGLGLVISHDIVAEFGGDLTAKRLSPGARFTISLRNAA
jgi:two-component system C4-dicarboxylate transport sensor histidine kinase DctB